MMRQMPSAQPLLEPIRGMREMNPVVNNLVQNESSDEPIKPVDARRIAKNRNRRQRNRCHWYPCADSKHRMRILMMHRVQGSREGTEPMPEPSVNRILDEAPGEDSAGKQNDAHEHNV